MREFKVAFTGVGWIGVVSILTLHASCSVCFNLCKVWACPGGGWLVGWLVVYTYLVWL